MPDHREKIILDWSAPGGKALSSSIWMLVQAILFVDLPVNACLF